MTYTLTALTTAGIQSYIFGSNDLRENIGASEIVYRATSVWAFEQLANQEGKKGINVQIRDEQTADWCYLPTVAGIEDPDSPLTAEVIYAGGGNLVVLFKDDQKSQRAHDFVYALGLAMLKRAPGLGLYAAHTSFNWGQDNLAQKVDDVMEEMNKGKSRYPVYLPQPGLSVTAACTSTGLPANGTHLSLGDDGDRDKAGTLADLASNQVLAKWEAFQLAQKRLRQQFPAVEDPAFGFTWSDNFDKIGKLPERDESFIAVVHADGNGMGRRIISLGNVFKQASATSNPRAYIQAVRTLSKAFAETATVALKKTVCALLVSLEAKQKQNELLYYEEDDKNRQTRRILPFRPIVFGGDDVTFVCTGGWGLSLAHYYLKALEQGALLPGLDDLLANLNDTERTQAEETLGEAVVLFRDDTKRKPYACAGICIVKTHYPFSQAYHTSEELAKSAKKRVQDLQKDKTASAIDWHFTTTGLSGKLEQIRLREYLAAERDEQGRRFNLLARPLMLDHSYSWRSWDSFTAAYHNLASSAASSHTKLMALREALRSGPTSVQQYQAMGRSAIRLNPHLRFEAVMRPESQDKEKGEVQFDLTDGWVRVKNAKPDYIVSETCCALFDAIEMEEQFFELETGEAFETALADCLPVPEEEC